jgi:hypothetical protein
METTHRPLTARQKKELEGYVAWSVVAGRAVLFVVAAAIIIKGFQLLHAVIAAALPLVAHPVWWVVPSLVCILLLYVRAARWTGGRRLRARIRDDLAAGNVAAHRIHAVDAIEVPEQEDEGSTFFVRTDDGEIVMFAGQYLSRQKAKGFPWATVEILEAPSSKIFFGLRREGASLDPTVLPEPLSWEETKRLGCLHEDYGIVDLDFEELKKTARL